jgi:hypothetical protein
MSKQLFFDLGDLGLKNLVCFKFQFVINYLDLVTFHTNAKFMQVNLV